MKRNKNTILLLILLVGIVVFGISRIKRPIPLDQGWSQPIAVTGTQSADMGGGHLYKWHGTLMLMQSRYDYSSKSSTCSIMIRNHDSSNSWAQIPISDVPGDCAFYCPAFDEANNRIVFERGYIESNQLHMGTVFIHMTANGRTQAEAEREWTRNQESLLGKTDHNVTLNDPAILGLLGLKVKLSLKVNRDHPQLGKGLLTDSEVCIPYSLSAFTLSQPKTISHGPYSSGIFYSTNLGKTWQMEKIAELDAAEPEMCRTKDYCYYFGMTGGGIWFSQKSVDGGSWSEPKFLTKTFANSRGGGAAVEGDMVYFCWLDRRHEKWRLNIDRPYVGNYEVAYRQRKDTDSTWRKDVIVSKGMLFSYWPSMSVEGGEIVIAWVGAISQNDAHDVFYVTSKDGGKTWARPLKVTDRAKDGITSEQTQVALQDGIIHLFYAQGQWDRHAQVWNQGGWPIYHQQRPFPD
jgi:hypothetical protein